MTIKELAILPAVSILISLIAAEMYFRTFSPQIMEHHKMFRYDPSLGWTFVPDKKGAIFYPGEVSNYIKTNHHGFRDTTFPSAHDQLKKIIVLGDSFVSNISITAEDVFTEVMEANLDGTTVMNFGVNGYSTVQEYILLDKVLHEYTPELLILLIYIRNDFVENLGFAWSGIQRPKALLNGDASDILLSPVPGYRPQLTSDHPIIQLLKKFHVCYFIKRRSEYIIHRVQHLIKPSLAFTPTKLTPEELYLCRRIPNKKTIVMYRIMELLLLKFAEACQSHDVPLLFVIAPSMVQVGRDLWAHMLDQYKQTGDDYDCAIPNRKLVAFAKKARVPILDLLPVLQTATLKGQSLYNLKEQHWTKEGNHAVAYAILDYLKSQKNLGDLIFSQQASSLN